MNNLDMPHLSTKDSAINCAETEYVVLGLPLEYLQKLDDPLEALVLSRITHWYLGEGVGRRLKSSTHKWLTKTTAELMAETGIKKEKQVRDALHALEHKHKLIEVVVGGFAGKKTKFIRLLCANGKSTITGWQQVFDAHHSVDTTHVTTPILTSVNTTHASVDTTLLIAVVTCSGDLESKPVDEKTTSTVIFESHLKSGKDEKTKPESKAKLSPDAVKKVPKFLSWGKTFDEAVVACHGAPKVALPEDLQALANRNLKLMCRRMLAAKYTPDQVHDFLRWVGGEGWYDLRTEWGNQWHPDIHKSEQVDFRPDINWLVGNPKHGTGAHRLEAALSIWEHYTNQHPQEQPAKPQEPPATPMVNVSHAVETSTPVTPAVAPEPESVDPRLSVADAWELIERASALIPLIEVWRNRVAAGVPTPALAEYLAGPHFTAEKLEIALMLVAPVEPMTDPEPEPEPVECPALVQADSVSPTTAPAPCVEDYDEAPLSEEAKLKNLAAWLPGATQKQKELEAAKKAAEAKHNYTASANCHYPPKGKATLHSNGKVKHGNASLAH